jgi:hypothetical protein
MRMARLWRDQGTRDDPACGWFTAGFDARDLKDAQGCSTSWRHEKAVAFRRREMTLMAPCIISLPR